MMSPKTAKKDIAGPSNEGEQAATSASSPPKHFIAKRLQLIVSPEKKKYVKKDYKKTSRRKGKHSFLNFVDFPLDIVYEIANYLSPSDLLNLARLSKDFRAFFLSRATANVWKRALCKVVELPPCPEDLCEPQYASLLFDTFCMACGSTRASLTTDYTLRLRFCTACTKLNVCTGRAFINHEENLCDVEVLAFIPAGMKNIIRYLANKEYTTKKMNLPKLTYFKPELQALQNHFLRLDTRNARAFASIQTEIATRMMHEGFAMQRWDEYMQREKEREIKNMIDARATRLKQEMVNTGWEEKYFPNIWSHNDEEYQLWYKLMNIPAEFTMEEWDHLFPLFEILYNHNKKQKLLDDLIKRAVFRYLRYRSEQPLEQKRLMPGARDIVNTGTFFSQFLADNFENCSEEKLDAFMSEIMENTQDFLPNIKNSLVAQITVEDCSQPSDAEILNRAANLFLCGCSSCWFIRENMNLKVVKPYPEVIYHVLGKDDVQDGMSGWSAQKISVDPLVLQAGRDILEVLGLSPNTMRDEVAKLGKLECRCGHHAYSDVALTFEQLAEHIFQERKWNERMEKRIDERSKHLKEELLQDGHSLDRLKTLVGIAPSGMDAFDEKAYYDQERDLFGRVIPTVYPDDLPCPLVCRSCYRLTLLSWPYQDAAAHYHIKTKHGRDRQDDDFAPLDVLVDDYGGNNMNEIKASGCHIPQYSFTS